jgi:hypothetical protein
MLLPHRSSRPGDGDPGFGTRRCRRSGYQSAIQSINSLKGHLRRYRRLPSRIPGTNFQLRLFQKTLQGHTLLPYLIKATSLPDLPPREGKRDSVSFLLSRDPVRIQRKVRHDRAVSFTSRRAFRFGGRPSLCLAESGATDCISMP